MSYKKIERIKNSVVSNSNNDTNTNSGNSGNSGDYRTPLTTKKRRHHNKHFTPWLLWGIVILLLLAILGSQIPKMDFENNYVALILGFIGVLTTFIVIGNYAQIVNIERTLYKKEKELEQKINDRLKDTECKTSSFLHYKDAMAAKMNVDIFNSCILAIASWHDAYEIDVNVIDCILSKILIVINRNKVEVIAEQFDKIDGYALDCCLTTLYRKEIKDAAKHKVISYINQLKDVSKNKIIYDGVQF